MAERILPHFADSDMLKAISARHSVRAYSVIASIVVGVPGGEIKAASRNKPRILSWKR